MKTLDRLLQDVMGSALGAATNPNAFDPAVDIRANDDEVCIVCDVPGVKRSELTVTVENHVLSVKGARRFDHRIDEQVVLGRSYGGFQRSFHLPTYLDEAKLEAQLEDGVLTIRIPKREDAKPRAIPIGGGPVPKRLKE